MKITVYYYNPAVSADLTPLTFDTIPDMLKALKEKGCSISDLFDFDYEIGEGEL